MNKKIALGSALALMAIVAAVTFAITVSFTMRDFNTRMENLKSREKMYDRLAEVDQKVRQKFFGEVDEAVLMDAIIRGYVNGLGDKYSFYFTADEYAQQMQSYEGKLVDIGVSTVMDPTGYIRITEVYPDSSASSAGLQKGDIIVKVEDTDVNSENAERMMNAMRGDPGTKVKIVVRRDAEDVPMEITRRKTEVPTVTSAQYESVGYIKIKEFSNNTPAQFNKELDKLLAGNVQALIFDVRNNPGGTIDSVTTILDRLLPEGDLVSATYKDGTTELLAVSDANEVNLPMVVITNGRSASASELFAQAIKDYNKGRTVGTNTYGKGMMQTIYPLSDGSALDITVAKYNPPKSPNFDGVGVKPDYEVKMSAEQEKVFYDLDETSDPQLKKALELANAVIKTGGFDGLSKPSEEPETVPPEGEGEGEGEESASDADTQNEDEPVDGEEEESSAAAD